MVKSTQNIQITAIAQALVNLNLPYTYHDQHKNLLSVYLNNELVFFTQAVTPFNNQTISRICDDKDFTYRLLKNKIRMPKTLSFFDPQALKKYNAYKKQLTVKEIVSDILTQFDLPVIIKKNTGKQGQNVFLCSDPKAIELALQKIFNRRSVKYDYLALAQTYIKKSKEYRVIFFNQQLLLAYTKDISGATFTGNLSPLHWQGAKSQEIIDPETLNNLTDFIKPIFTYLPINFTGFDILEAENGKLYLLEANTRPGFDYFVRDHSLDRLILMYETIFKTFT